MRLFRLRLSAVCVRTSAIISLLRSLFNNALPLCFLPRIVKELCNVTQQNALFKLRLEFISCRLHVSNTLCSSSGRLYCTCSLIWHVFHAFMQAETYHIRLHVQYNLPNDEYKMFETCRRREDLNLNTNLKSVHCRLILHN